MGVISEKRQKTEQEKKIEWEIQFNINNQVKKIQDQLEDATI